MIRHDFELKLMEDFRELKLTVYLLLYIYIYGHVTVLYKIKAFLLCVFKISQTKTQKQNLIRPIQSTYQNMMEYQNLLFLEFSNYFFRFFKDGYFLMFQMALFYYYFWFIL